MLQKHEISALGGFAPAASGIPFCDCAVLPARNRQKIPIREILRHRMRPRPQRVHGWRKGGDYISKNRFSIEQFF